MSLDPENNQCQAIFKEGTITGMTTDSIQVEIDWEYAVGYFWCEWYYDCGGSSLPTNPSQIYAVGDKVIVEADPDQYPLKVVGLSEGARACYSAVIAEIDGGQLRILYNGERNVYIDWRAYARAAYYPNVPSGYTVECVQFAPNWPYRIAINVKAEGDGYVVPHNADHIVMVWNINPDTYFPIYEGYVKYSVGDIPGFETSEKVRGCDGTYGDINQSQSCYGSDYVNTCGSYHFSCVFGDSGEDDSVQYHGCVDHTVWSWEQNFSHSVGGSVCNTCYLDSASYSTQIYLPKSGEPLLWIGGTRRGTVSALGDYDHTYTYNGTMTVTESPSPYGATCNESFEDIVGCTCITHIEHWEHNNTTDYDYPPAGVYRHGESGSYSWSCSRFAYPCGEEWHDEDWSVEYATSGKVMHSTSDDRPLGSAVWKVLATQAAGDWGSALYEMDLEYPWLDGCEQGSCHGEQICCTGDLNYQYNDYERSTRLGRVIGNDSLWYHYIYEQYTNEVGEVEFTKRVWNQPLGHSISISNADQYNPDLPAGHILRPTETGNINSVVFFTARRVGPTGWGSLRSWSPILNGDTTAWDADFPDLERDAREIRLKSGLAAPLNDPFLCGLLIDKDGGGWVRTRNNIYYYDSFKVTNAFSDPIEVAPSSGPLISRTWYYWGTMDTQTAYCIYKPE